MSLIYKEFSFQIYVNFHKGNLITDSDRRKYKDLFAKTIANEMSNSLPVLGSLPPAQSKNSKLNKSSLPISMPTNLNTLIENETAANSTNSSTNAQSSNENSNSMGNLITCSEVPVVFRPQLPCLAPSKAHGGPNKAQLARQVTNVIKRHHIEARQQITDKII